MPGMRAVLYHGRKSVATPPSWGKRIAPQPIIPRRICLPSQLVGRQREVDGNCTGDSLHSLLKCGDSPPASILEYIVIEDQVVLRQGTFNLQPDETESIRLPATGFTVRLAQQEPFHPGAGILLR